MNTQAISDTRQAPRPLWQNYSFMLLWVSAAAAGFGDRLIELVAMPLLGVTEKSSQASVIQAGIYFFFFVPWLFVCPIGGWLADTFPRKWVLFSCDIARGLILLLAWYWIYQWKPHGTSEEMALAPEFHYRVFLILSLVGTFAAIFGPTKNAFVPQVVPGAQLQSANAIVLGISVVASLIGMVVGGHILEKWSVAAGLMIGFIVYTVSAHFFLLMKVNLHHGEAIDKKSEFQRLIEAWDFCRQHRPILILILLTTLFWGAAQVFLAALAAFCKNNYGIPPNELVSQTAMLNGFLGAGMLSGSLMVSWISSTRESSWFAFICLIISASAMLIMTVVSSYNVAAGLCFVVGITGSAALICTATLMQSITPDYIRGRVFGFREVVSTSLGVLVNLVIWQLPNAQKQWPRLPTADALMAPSLRVTALMLVVVGVWGVHFEMSRGPMPTALANYAWHLLRFFSLFWHRLKWDGRESVPHAGPVVLVCKTGSSITPALVQASLPRLLQLIGPSDLIPGWFWRGWRGVPRSFIDANGTFSRQSMVGALRDQKLVFVVVDERPGAGTGENILAEITRIASETNAVVVPVHAANVRKTTSPLGWIFSLSKARLAYGKPMRFSAEQSPQTAASQLNSRLDSNANQVSVVGV